MISAAIFNEHILGFHGFAVYLWLHGLGAIDSCPIICSLVSPTEHLEKQRDTILTTLRSSLRSTSSCGSQGSSNLYDQANRSTAVTTITTTACPDADYADYAECNSTSQTQPPLLRSHASSNNSAVTTTHCQSTPVLYSRPSKPYKQQRRDLNGSRERYGCCNEPPKQFYGQMAVLPKTFAHGSYVI